MDSNVHVSQREVVRAVGKTEDIVRRLIRKHPRGVPVPEYMSPASSHTRVHVLTNLDLRDAEDQSASSAPPKRDVLNKSRKGTLSLSPVRATSEDCTDPKGTYTPCFRTLRQQSSLTTWLSPPGKGKLATEAVSLSPSSSTEALEQLLYPEGK